MYKRDIKILRWDAFDLQASHATCQGVINMQKKLESQLNFIFEIDRLKAVYRKTMVKSDNNRARK